MRLQDGDMRDRRNCGSGPLESATPLRKRVKKREGSRREEYVRWVKSKKKNGSAGAFLAGRVVGDVPFFKDQITPGGMWHQIDPKRGSYKASRNDTRYFVAKHRGK